MGVAVPELRQDESLGIEVNAQEKLDPTVVRDGDHRATGVEADEAPILAVEVEAEQPCRGHHFEAETAPRHLREELVRRAE